MIMADNSSSAPLSAKLAKAALFLLVAPTTRLLAMLGGVTRHDTFLHRCFSHFAGLINWAGQGAITLAYPSMRYNPVAWRKQRMAWNWAEQVTGCSEIELDAAARDFISRYQSLPPNAVALSDLTFTIVVGFHSHLQYLEHCIRSISETLNSSENVSVDLIYWKRLLRGTFLPKQSFARTRSIWVSAAPSTKPFPTLRATGYFTWIVMTDYTPMPSRYFKR